MQKHLRFELDQILKLTGELIYRWVDHRTSATQYGEKNIGHLKV